MIGIEARPIQVEVDCGRGLPGLEVIGLADASVRESRVRVRSALGACGHALPARHIVINLVPADLRKAGAGLDLPIAVALMASTGSCAAQGLDATLLAGELSLAGELRPVRGVLPLLRMARHQGLANAIVPTANAADAACVAPFPVYLATHLAEVVAFLEGRMQLPLAGPGHQGRGAGQPHWQIADGADLTGSPGRTDLADVRGQLGARRALEIAAAGRHHLLMLGPPGSGKTMLAARLPGLLPPPTPDERLEIATIASVAGPGGSTPWPRPFRAPHHTASAQAIIGGGPLPSPGEVTLASGGVLFLDELPEFRRDVLESLRTTMESGQVVVARARSHVRMPANPLVVAAANPCPCGYAGDSKRCCSCAPNAAARYLARLSGPLIDRFDLHVRVQRVGSPRHAPPGETTAVVAARVQAAHERQRARGEASASLDALLGATDRRGLSLLDQAVDQLGMSARSYTKVLRVARTIADLADAPTVQQEHIAEAVQYRVLDRDPFRQSRAPALAAAPPPASKP